MPRITWTDEKIAEAHRALRSASTEAVAERYGVRPAVLRSALNKRGLGVTESRGGRRKRKTWTDDEVAAVVSALRKTSAVMVARLYGVDADALREMLYRRGVTVRRAKRTERVVSDRQRLFVRRSEDGHVASYGAAALEVLPEHACRWPIGDPAKPGFRYCAEPRSSDLSSYCAEHRARAYRS